MLAALYELVRGFQAADDQRRGDLLREVLADDPNHVYAGLLTVLMRLVFILYAEDRDLLSNDEVYSEVLLGHRPVRAAPRGRRPAHRHDGPPLRRLGAAPDALPPDPRRRTPRRDEAPGSARATCSTPIAIPSWKAARRARSGSPASGTDPPHVSDGVVFRVLHNLLILDGERLSYRTLDVEQIGSVYETMMGFNLEVAQGRSIAIKPTKSHGAPTTINLEELLAGQACRAGEVAQAEDRPGRSPARPLTALKEAEDARGCRGRAGEEGGEGRHAPHRAAGGDGPPAERRAPQVGLALHPAFAHRADRARRRSRPILGAARSRTRRPSRSST